MADDWQPLESDDEFGDLGRPAALRSSVGGVPQQESQPPESEDEFGDLGLPAAPRSSVGGVPQQESQPLVKHTSESTASCPSSSAAPSTAAVAGGVPPIVDRGRRRGCVVGRSRAVRGLATSLRRKASARSAAEGQAAAAKAPARERKLKRRVSDTKPEEAKATSMICIWGGVVRTPVVAQPVWTEAGTTWMSPNEHWQWLRRACCTRGLTHYKELFQSAVSALRRELQNGLKAANDPDPAGALRAALDLESDDDDDGQRSGKKKAACPPRTRRPAALPKTVDVMVGDVKMKVQNKLRPLRVECTEASVNGVIAFCRKHVLDGKADLKKYRVREDGGQAAERSTFVMPTDDCPIILGKVTWQPSHHAWCVHGKAGSGATFSTRVRVSGLDPHQPAGNGIGGSFLKPAEKRGCVDGKESYNIERRSRYIEAIEIWNEKDKSSRDRILVPKRG